MYERQHGNGFEIGSYAHRAILMDPDDIPSIAAAALSPTMLPFTQDDFDPQLEDALELFPAIVGDESVGVKLAINGLLSLTPDGNPIIGETPEVKNLWSVAAIWIKEAPGIAKTVAEWMTHGDARDRPARLGHRPLLRAPQDGPAHRRPDDRGLQQDLRHRPPDGAVGVEPADPPVTRVRPPRRARRGLLRGGRLGATVLVRHERGPARRVRRAGDAPQGGVGIALVVADHQRRAPRDARPGRARRPVGVRDLRRHGPRRPGRARAAVRQQGRRPGRADRLHAAPQRGRRHPRRPDDHAPRLTTGSGS